MSINQYSLLIHYIIKRFVEFGQLHCKIMDLHWAILCTDVLMLFVVCSLTQSNVTGDRWQVNWSSLESSFFFKVLPKASKLVPHVSLVVPIFVLLFIFSGNPSEQPCQPSEKPVFPPLLLRLTQYTPSRAGLIRKILPSWLSNTGELNFNIKMFSNWECVVLL